MAEIPAINGICTAKSLARFYATLIGEVDGTRLFDADTVANATTEHANGIDRVMLMPTRPALGFFLPVPETLWGSPTAGYDGFIWPHQDALPWPHLRGISMHGWAMTP